MAITYTKIVSEVATVKIGTQNETVLVDFVRVVGNKPDSCSESILGDHISLNKLGLDLLHLSLDAIHHLYNFALQFCWCRGCRLKLRIENHLIILESCKISGLVDLRMTPAARLFQGLQLLI